MLSDKNIAIASGFILWKVGQHVNFEVRSVTLQ